jgi:hypothetical protein
VVSNPQSKDDALEALDFIVNVLKEHEKDLDKLINELATVTEQLGDAGQLGGKVDKIEEKMNKMQKEVANLITCLSNNKSKETSQASAVIAPSTQMTSGSAPVDQHLTTIQNGPSVILRCARWEDFQTLAFQAQTLSFSYKEDQKIFEADALKGNRVITYCGEAPNLPTVLKTWLSKQLNVDEGSVLEGVLAIG